MEEKSYTIIEFVPVRVDKLKMISLHAKNRCLRQITAGIMQINTEVKTCNEQNLQENRRCVCCEIVKVIEEAFKDNKIV